jgi:hypothetical protein
MVPLACIYPASCQEDQLSIHLTAMHTQRPLLLLNVLKWSQAVQRGSRGGPKGVQCGSRSDILSFCFPKRLIQHFFRHHLSYLSLLSLLNISNNINNINKYKDAYPMHQVRVFLDVLHGTAFNVQKRHLAVQKAHKTSHLKLKSGSSSQGHTRVKFLRHV